MKTSFTLLPALTSHCDHVRTVRLICHLFVRAIVGFLEIVFKLNKNKKQKQIPTVKAFFFSLFAREKFHLCTINLSRTGPDDMRKGNACPPNRPFRNCSYDQVCSAPCARLPNARCLVDHCGGCRPVYLGALGHRVNCSTGHGKIQKYLRLFFRRTLLHFQSL